mmetsp:Transcript_27655/g.82843  ORF Transcript_27655/g.82843 Transcript_27655/m.82843 type:complete len:232 (+) Transcript_27655:1577-2272(+)
MSALSAKPSDEEIARRRAAKNAQKQAAPKKAPPAAAPPKKKARDPEAEAAALKESAVGALVDVGANLQSRGKYDDVARQLRRAALAGVSRVVLTGCDVAGADAGRACCERWAAADEPSGLKLAFTAGVHPHDAKDWTGETSDAIEALAAHPARGGRARRQTRDRRAFYVFKTTTPARRRCDHHRKTSVAPLRVVVAPAGACRWGNAASTTTACSRRATSSWTFSRSSARSP